MESSNEKAFVIVEAEVDGKAVRLVWKPAVEDGGEPPAVVIEWKRTDALGDVAWQEQGEYCEGNGVYALVMKLAEQRSTYGTARDAQRYRRLRALGAAPGGTVLRATGLDDFVDTDIRIVSSRGEAK